MPSEAFRYDVGSLIWPLCAKPLIRFDRGQSLRLRLKAHETLKGISKRVKLVLFYSPRALAHLSSQSYIMAISIGSRILKGCDVFLSQLL